MTWETISPRAVMKKVSGMPVTPQRRDVSFDGSLTFG